MFLSAKVKLEGRHLRGFITIRPNTCVKQFYTITVEQLILKKIWYIKKYKIHLDFKISYQLRKEIFFFFGFRTGFRPLKVDD